MKPKSATQSKVPGPLALYLATYNAHSPALVQATRHWAVGKLDKQRTPRPPLP